jgi:hypothetical protein
LSLHLLKIGGDVASLGVEGNTEALMIHLKNLKGITVKMKSTVL